MAGLLQQGRHRDVAIVCYQLGIDCPGLVLIARWFFRSGRATGSDKCAEVFPEKGYRSRRRGVFLCGGRLWTRDVSWVSGVVDGFWAGSWAMGIDLNAPGGLLVF